MRLQSQRGMLGLGSEDVGPRHESSEKAMAFKVFEKGSAPVPSVPSVTIQKKGLFSLNDAAVRLLDDPEAVQFLWDEDRRVIGLQAVPLATPNAYPARRQGAAKGNKQPNRGPVLVAGTMFTKFIELDTSQAKRWIPRMEGDVLIIDLNEPGQPVTSNRNRNKQQENDGD